jgi:hypothetical protein
MCIWINKFGYILIGKDEMSHSLKMKVLSSFSFSVSLEDRRKETFPPYLFLLHGYLFTHLNSKRRLNYEKVVDFPPPFFIPFIQNFLGYW